MTDLDNSGHCKTRRRAVDETRLHRRQRERGPRQCIDCDRAPTRDVMTFRRHVVLKHIKHCSWPGHARPFIDQVEADRIRAVIHLAGRQNGGQRLDANTERDPQLAVRLLRLQTPSICSQLFAAVDTPEKFVTPINEVLVKSDQPLSDCNFDELLQ
jgi:hypothetical protein